jgi:hypothetical protein
MAKYTTHSDGTSSVNREQTENNTGIAYRASGNLFIAKQTSKTIPKSYLGCRGDIVGFSAGSAIRMRRYLRECRASYRCMVTLTYPGFFETDGVAVKNHLRRFLQEVQREYIRGHKPNHDYPYGGSVHGTGQNYQGNKQLHSAFWFLEFQERGAPHFHIFFNWAPSKEWVSKRWYEIVGSEDIRHFHAGTRTEKILAGRAGTISYASKYANKCEQKVVPDGYKNVGRFWGVYGDRITMSAATFVSVADRANQNVSWCEEQLLNAVKSLISKGIAEIVKREEGILIVVCHDTMAMQKIRTKVSRVSAHTMKLYDMFCDAEVEYGAIYNDESLLYPTKQNKEEGIY